MSHAPSLASFDSEVTADNWSVLAELSEYESREIYDLLIKTADALSSAAPASAAAAAASTPASSALRYPTSALTAFWKACGVEALFAARGVALHVPTSESKTTGSTHSRRKKAGLTREEIREKTVLQQADKQLPALQALAGLAALPGFAAPGSGSAAPPGSSRPLAFSQPFSSLVAEVVLAYYALRASAAEHAQIPEDFVDAAFSLRDALRYYNVSDATCRSFRDLLQHFGGPRFPWKTFMQSHTRLLIQNHFRRNYQRAVEPYPEQQQLLTEVVADPVRLFVMPWGVGVGKTALVPVLASLYARTAMGNHLTLYCVPCGPVRDQNAAYLMRCGVPFAFITRIVGDPDASEEWELHPSFLCSSESSTFPTVLIVEPAFVAYYLRYLRYRKEQEDAGFVPLAPSVRLPSQKRRYAHLKAHRAVFREDIVLALDEPNAQDAALQDVLANLPPVSFVMSATSCAEVLSPEVRAAYLANNPECAICEVPAQNIGVSTTLLASFHHDAVLSPFSGAVSRAQFGAVLSRASRSVLWRRFLSPKVFMDWVNNVRPKCSSALRRQMQLSFDLLKLSFDDISKRVIEWAAAMYDSAANADDPDAFFAEHFAMLADERTPEDSPVQGLVSTRAQHLTGGCVVGTDSVADLYERFGAEIETVRVTVDSVADILEKHCELLRQRVAGISQGRLSSREQRQERDEELAHVERDKMTYIPVPERYIINSDAHRRHNTPPGQSAPPDFQPTLQQMLVETGNLLKEPEQWTLSTGATPRVPELHQSLRWHGIGGIAHSREFFMKNIRDSNEGYLAYLLADETGAYGLNLKIRHAVLLDPLRTSVDRGHEGANGYMSPSVYFQIAGRVGRNGQDETGFVHVQSPELFQHIFQHKNAAKV